MAFDFIKGHQTKDDWSCGLSDSPGSSPSPKTVTIAKVATVGVIGLAVWILANQPSGDELQKRHYEREFGGRRHV